MFKNYLKITFRNLRKNKIYGLINIFGLAIGMACTIIILLWAEYELGYDEFHQNSKEIYWAVRKYVNPDGSTDFSPVTVLPLAGALKSEYPEILKATRYNEAFDEFPLRFKDKTLFAKGSPADQDFFNIFTFPFKYGNATYALENSNSIVITNSISEKFFGESDPVGQTLQFELWGQWWDFMVTGVIEDIPKNSHFKFDLLFSTAFLINRGWDENNWLNGCVKTYILTMPGIDAVTLTKKIADINLHHHPQATASIHLQPLNKIHLYNLDDSGRIIYVYIFATIAFFILLISCINFINLSTACSEKRAKEVGVRKVIGAFRRQLGIQFLVESIVFSFLSLVIALLIVDLSTPLINKITVSELHLNYNGSMVLWFAGIALFAGVVSGIYPAIIMSSATILNVLKGGKRGKGIHSLPVLRKILVGFQFMLSIILIIGIITIHKQLSFMENKDLGFDKEHVICLTLRSELRNQKKFETIKNELLKNPEIISMTACNSNFTNWQYTVNENDISWPGKQPQDKVEMEVNSVDYDYLSTFGMKLAQGRFFSQDFAADASEAVILNETAVKVLSLQNPVGQHIQYRGNRQIVGIIKDFNFYSLHQQIQPMVLTVTPFLYHSLYIKIRSTKQMETIQSVERTIKRAIPDYPFVYNFLDDNLNRLYNTEQNVWRILMTFSFLAIFISCLGIFGLIAYVAERRTKEIGIRKTLGASVAGMVVLLTKDFTKWILFANIIAWPVAYFAMNKWLHNFAYRIDMSWWMFALAGGIALVIAFLTVSWQAIRAATANPVEALRYE
jgi:putative ABC transport system permease protein